MPDPFVFSAQISPLDDTYSPIGDKAASYNDCEADELGVLIAGFLKSGETYTLEDGEDVEPTFEVVIERSRRT